MSQVNVPSLAVKRRKSSKTTFTYFPDSIKNEQHYLRFLKQLTYFTVSTICYNRELFDTQGNYNHKWHSVVPINILSPEAVDPNVRNLIHALITATSLIDSKNLKQLIFGLLLDPEKPDELVEYYCLEYNYIKDYAQLNDLSSKCLSLMTDIEDHSRSTDAYEQYYFVVKLVFGGESFQLDGFHKSNYQVNSLVSSKLVASIDDVFSVSVPK